ncbi:hypothetical protein [Kistimonas asteriae]|uniref:hypothetical protein n=1 Tax=Kistimonas asteriae TaxID=517724 RepID=UPI001BACC21C|nr:hypothetical protein [Kistimonas asteriae]
MFKTQTSNSSQANPYVSYNPAEPLLPEFQTKAGVSLSPTSPTKMSEPDATFPEIDPTGIDTRKVENINKRKTPEVLFALGVILTIAGCAIGIAFGFTFMPILIPFMILGLGAGAIFFEAAFVVKDEQYQDLLKVFNKKGKTDEVSDSLHQPIFTVDGGAKCSEVAPFSDRRNLLDSPQDTASPYTERY